MSQRSPGVGHNNPPPKTRDEMTLFESARHLQQAMGFDMTGTMTLTEVGFANKILARMNDATTGRLDDGSPAIWMNDETLMKLMRLGERQVTRLRKRVEELGVLLVERGKHNGQATRYAPGDLIWMPHYPDGCIDWRKASQADAGVDDGTNMSEPMTNMSEPMTKMSEAGTKMSKLMTNMSGGVDKFVIEDGQKCHPKQNYNIQNYKIQNYKIQNYKIQNYNTEQKIKRSDKEEDVFLSEYNKNSITSSTENSQGMSELKGTSDSTGMSGLKDASEIQSVPRSQEIAASLKESGLSIAAIRNVKLSHHPDDDYDIAYANREDIAETITDADDGYIPAHDADF